MVKASRKPACRQSSFDDSNNKVGTWNLRTMYETGKTAQVENEIKRYNIKVLVYVNFDGTDPA